jgi:hypothetical protein
MPMKKLPLMLALAIPALATAARVKGDGNLQTEKRDVTGFKSVELELPIDAEISEGPFAVTVKVDGNLLKHVSTRVDGERLIIESKDNLRDVHKDARVTIQVPEFRGIKIEGSGDAKVQGIKQRHPVRVDIEGSGDVQYDGAAESLAISVEGSGNVTASLAGDTGNVAVAIQGSGNVEVKGGRAENLTASIEGSGNVQARRLVAKSGTFSVEGTGNVDTTLDGGDATFLVEGPGNIHWWGDAKVRGRCARAPATSCTRASSRALTSPPPQRR